MKKLLRVLTYNKDVSDLIEYGDIRDNDFLCRKMFLKIVEDFLKRRLKLKDGLVLLTDYNDKGELVVEIGMLGGTKTGAGSVFWRIYLRGYRSGQSIPPFQWSSQVTA